MEFETTATPFVLEDLSDANTAYAERFTHGRLSNQPRRKTVILTCMDSRMDPFSFLGLKLGDAHIIRNAGGRVTPDVIRSLVVSQRVLGTRDVIIIHHTDCGLEGTTNESIRARISTDAGIKVDHIDFLPIFNLDSSVREDAAALRNSSVIRSDSRISGFVYDVRTGKLRRVS